MTGTGQATTAGGHAPSDGFTIIEVLFFLAISGALVAALLATVGFAVSRQRFTDSILTTQAYVQSEFSGALNVQNGRGDGSCTSGSGATVIGGGTTPRGASAVCVVLGRALVFTADSSRVTSYPVVGYEPTDPGNVTGARLLAKYQPSVDLADAQDFDIPWDAQPKATVRRVGTDIHVSRLYLLRSPDSNLILTYGGENIQSALDAGTATFNLCVTSSDISGAVSAVTLSPLSGSEGVTTKSDLDAQMQRDLC